MIAEIYLRLILWKKQLRLSKIIRIVGKSLCRKLKMTLIIIFKKKHIIARFPGIPKEEILPLLRSTHIDAEQALYESAFKEYSVNQGNNFIPKWKDSSGNWVVPDRVEDYVEAYNKSHEIGYQHFQQIIAKGVQGDIERWIAKYGKSYAVNYAQQAEYSVKEMENIKTGGSGERPL